MEEQNMPIWGAAYLLAVADDYGPGALSGPVCSERINVTGHQVLETWCLTALRDLGIISLLTTDTGYHQWCLIGDWNNEQIVQLCNARCSNLEFGPHDVTTLDVAFRTLLLAECYCYHAYRLEKVMSCKPPEWYLHIAPELYQWLAYLSPGQIAHATATATQRVRAWRQAAPSRNPLHASTARVACEAEISRILAEWWNESIGYDGYVRVKVCGKSAYADRMYLSVAGVGDGYQYNASELMQLLDNRAPRSLDDTPF